MDLIHVEDSESDAQLVLRILGQQPLIPNYTLLRDGASALDFFIGQAKTLGLSCKLILLDLKLPKVDGFEVLKQLKSNKETAAIPVVIFSASAINSDVERAYLLGANSYLVKPDSYGELKEVVQNLSAYWLQHNQTQAI